MTLSLISKMTSFLSGLISAGQIDHTRFPESEVPDPSPEATLDESPLSSDEIVDRRKTAAATHRRERRPWKKVTGICLHQTACVLGERPGRWDTIGAHFGVTRSGNVIWLHDMDHVVIHGNGWNAGTVGIEIDGKYEGVHGDISTFWRDKSDPNSTPQELTSESANATRRLIRFICEEVRRNGGEVKVLVAHRQASVNRRNDPGSQIWTEVALPIIDELGLDDGGVGFKIGNGYPIPEAWDPKKKGIRY